MKVLAVLAAFVALGSVFGVDEMEIEMLFESEAALHLRESNDRLFDDVFYLDNDKTGRIIYHNPVKDKLANDPFLRIS